ncbi:MAG TPA: hypothetical protein VIJ54_09435 [Actinomycetes bacterium]
MSRTARWTRAVAAALLVVAPALATAEPASASTSTPGYCNDSVGVTVVVDFQELGGGVVVRCFTHPASSSTGLDALLGTGFSVTGVARYGNDSFVCRIDGEPTAANEACIDTPPASYYWSYWSASNGGSWTYSSTGPMSHRAVHGGFEGWSFSDHRTATTSPPPRVAPVHPIAAPTTTAGPTRAPTRAPTPPTTGTAPGSTSRPPTATSSSPLAAANPARPTSGASASAAGVLAGGSSGPPISFVASRPQVAGGSAWSSVVGVVLVVAALGGATTVAVRRRRARLADGG